ncbi:hypothetical protein BDR26DRAFT_866289 [Obelidium mucronatum]|nr:hypothetical protein BDR26DRAFT_866289 [Obelidium mucronatum]
MPKETGGLEIEDPDLLPTMEEWQLVYSASVTADGSLTPQMSYDCDNFIMKYFQQPAVFRLSVCAKSAHARGWFSPNPLLCEQQAIPYYTRARKAIIRALGETPTYQTVQVLYQICLFAQWKGQPEIGRPLLKIAQELIIFLRLNIDPKHFGASIGSFALSKQPSGDAIRVSIDSTKIRAPAFIFDPHMIFEQNVLLPHICNIYSLISTIKKQNSSAPKSTSSILSQETLLHSLYLATHSSLPFHHLLIAHPMFLSSESQALILSAVGQCLDRAYRIAHLLIFYTLPHRPVYIANFYDIFPMFEAMISIWFLHCRMDPVWWSFNVVSHQSLVIQNRLLLLLLKTVGEVEDIVVAMKVASLGDIGGGSSIYDSRIALWGLLGMTVGTRLRWKGPIEENWKLFWKLND